MKNKDTIDRESVLGTLRAKAELLFSDSKDRAEGSYETAHLLNELELYELELQLQNEELKASYASLEMERLKFASLFNAAPVGYLILNSNGIILEVNKTGSQLLHNHTERIKGKALDEFIVRDSLHEYNAFINSIKGSTQRLQCELRLKTPTTETRYVQLDGITASASTESEQSYYITITDVTHAKSAQQKLWETTERLNQTLKASLTGTWMVKSKGTEVFLDEYSKNILELEDHLEQPDLDTLTALFIAEDRPKLKNLFSNCDDDWEIDLELRLNAHDQKTRTILVKGKMVQPLYGLCYFAGILTDITDRKRSLKLEEEHEKTQRRLLRRAAIEAQEKERAKLSAALHDSVCQILYGIRFNLNHLNKQDLSQNKLEGVNILLDQAIQELRTISVELTPSVLKDFGFTAGIKDMVQRLGHAGFRVTSHIDQRADLLPAETQLYVFRIIQELLNNSIKHSGANSASVKLSVAQEQVNITLSDPGMGFQYHLEEALKKGSGLRGIKNRVSLLDGKIEIVHAEGTIFKISFPKTTII